MKIQLNNRPEEFTATSMTITELLQAKNFTFKLLVVKINGRLIKRDNYHLTHIKDGDDVLVLHMISGG